MDRQTIGKPDSILKDTAQNSGRQTVHTLLTYYFDTLP